MRQLLLASASVVLLSGCATVFTGTEQPIHVNVVDKKSEKELPQARCSITDKIGRVHTLTQLPDTLTIAKDQGPLQVNCSQLGYHDYSSTINGSFNPVALLDILFWPTFFVDIGTGSLKEFPEHYTVEMVPAKK
ncbi:MAG: hypothetical protein ACHQAX_08570 [Gammaproteobacteria bacterium]